MTPCDILMIGQAGKPTGFARVISTLAAALSERFRIVQFGINYHGEKVVGAWVLEPSPLPADRLGIAYLPELLRQYQPKVIWICHDFWLYPLYYPAIRRFGLTRRTIFYCPVEGQAPDRSRVASLTDLGLLVCYSKNGRDTLLAEAELPGHGSTRVSLPPLEIIPHGVATAKFYPLPGGKPQARHTLFPDRPDLAEALIVLNANRNTCRKRIDLTLQSFAALAPFHPRLYLYLHMGNTDKGIDILQSASTLGISQRLLGLKPSEGHPATTDERLNLIYNACDIGVNTSTGEGWGLIALEHAATGACQIVPAHTACQEIWASHGLLTKLQPPEANGVIDPGDLTRILTLLSQDRNLLTEWSRKALARARMPEFDWETISRQWEEVLRKFFDLS